MQHKYKPLEHIKINETEAKPKFLKGKPDISNLTNRLEILAKQLGLPYESDSQSMLDAMIDKLETVPYCQFPISFSTADMVAYSHKIIDGERRLFILLGKKYNQTKWQFPGGFRDPGETSQQAAHREFYEEASLLTNVDKWHYIGELFVDDTRYRNTPHKITTTVFGIKILAKDRKKCKGGDDLEAVQWFDIEDVKENRTTILRDVHSRLFDFIVDKIK